MKNKLRIIAMLTLCAMLLSSVCSAALFDSVTPNDETGEIVIEGTVEGAKKGDSITIQILRQGMESSQLEDKYTSGAEGTFMRDFVYFTQVPADENGGYCETVSMDGCEPGFYWIRVNGVDAEEIYNSSKESREEIITSIKKYCTIGNTFTEDGVEITVTEESAISYLKENFDLANERSIWKKSFDLNDPVISNVSGDGLFKVFLSSVSELTVDNIKDKMTEAAYFTALNEDKIDIISCKDIFSLDETYVKAYEDYITEKSSFVSTYYKGKNYDTAAEVNTAFKDGVVLEWVKSLSSEESVKTIIESIGEDIGINMTDYNSYEMSGYKNELYTYVLGETFTGADDFISKVNAKITELFNKFYESGDGGFKYTNIKYYKDGSEITEITSGSISAKVTVKDISRRLYFVTVLYQDNKIIAADSDTEPLNFEYETTVTVPTDTDGLTLVSMLWTDNTGKVPVCPTSIMSTVDGEGENAELISLSVDNGKLEFDPNDEDGVFEVVLEDPGRAKAPFVTYTTADSSAKVEIIDAKEFPGETLVRVTEGSAQKEYKIVYSYEGDLVSDINQEGGRAENIFLYRHNLQPGDRILGHTSAIPTAHVDEEFIGCDYFTAASGALTSFKLLRGATVNVLAVSGRKDATYLGDWSSDNTGWDRYWWNNWPDIVPGKDAGYKWNLEKDGYTWAAVGVNNKDSVQPNPDWTYSNIGDGLNEFPPPSPNADMTFTEEERIMYEKSAYDVRQQGWIYIDYRSEEGYHQDRQHSFGALVERYYKNFEAGSTITFNQQGLTEYGAPCVLQWNDWEPNDYSDSSMSGGNIGSGSAVDSVNIEDNKVTLTAKALEGTEKNDSITIQVLKKDLSFDNITGVVEDDYVYITQIPADENGGYSVSINMTGEPTGFYWVRVNGSNVQEIYYSSSSEREEIIQAIKENCGSGTDEASAISYLKENFDLTNERSIWRKSFDINDPIVFDVTEDGLFKVFLNSVSELTINNIKDKMTEAAYIAALNEDKIDIISVKDVFGLDETYVKAYEDHVSDKDEFVSAYYEGKNYDSAAEINNVFEDSVLLEWVNNFSSWADVRDIIEDFGEDIDIDIEDFNSDEFSSHKSSLYSYVLELLNGGGFASVDDFANKVNSKIANLLKTGDDDNKGGGGNSGNGGGGGGRGSGAATGGTAGTAPIVSTDTAPKDPTQDTDPDSSSAFSDMAGFEWAAESVNALAEKGIVSGTGDGKYEPERNVTREEMLVMLLRAFEVEIGSEASDFTDAAADGWYTSYLAAAKEAGFVSGKPDGSFGVGEAVTREDAAVMAYNIAKAKAKEFNIEKGEAFADDADISEYAVDAVYALKNAEIINGKGEGVFAPKDNCTRAEAAKIIYMLIK